jgi:hypothetical protein
MRLQLACRRLKHFDADPALAPGPRLYDGYRSPENKLKLATAEHRVIHEYLTAFGSGDRDMFECWR